MKTEQAQNSDTLPLIKSYSHSPKKDSLETFSSLVQQIQAYKSMQNKNKQGEMTLTELTNERLTKLQAINAMTDELCRSGFFQESERMDCFQQGLHAIKSIHDLSLIKQTKKSLGERKASEISKIALQKEMIIIQKLTDFLLHAAIPDELTPKIFQGLLGIIIGNLFSIRVSAQPKEKAKGKKKDPLPSVTVIQYCLLSGQKINLPWLIVFRVLQRKYYQTNLDEVYVTRDAVGQCIDGNLNKMIRTVLSFIKTINDSHVILKNLLACLVDNIKEIELPVIPLFLTIFNQTIKQQFKDTYIQRGPIPAHLFLGKAIYSIDNLNILCNLIKNIHIQMSSFQMQKQFMFKGLCSYCGLNKSIDSPNNPYQSIKIKLSNNDHLVMRICWNCCQQLGIQPENKLQIILFAPLISSKFWDLKENDNLKEVKYCLNHLLIYHGYSLSKTSKKPKKGNQISIASFIAMNNVEEKVNPRLIENIYESFLFNHSIVSIKQTIYETLNLLLICINSLDQKVKQKTLKLLNQPHILSFIFNDQQKTPSIYSQQVTAFRQKFIAIVLIKLRDASYIIRNATLELLSSIYSREDVDCGLKVDFYQTVYKQVSFYNNPEYISKCVNIIDRSIFKLMHYNNQDQLTGFVKIAVQTLQFNRSCLARLKEKENNQVKTQICKLNCKIMQAIIDLTTKDLSSSQQAIDMARAFNQAFQINKINKQNLKSVYDLLLSEAFKKKVMDQQIMKNLPKITPSIISIIINPQTSYQSELQLNNVKTNLTQLISIAFQDVNQAKSIIFGQNQRQVTKSKPTFNYKELRNYFFSKTFFEQLLSIKQNGGLKQLILNELLSISNFCKLVINRGYFSSSPLKAFLKGKDKWMRCIQFSTYELSMQLLQYLNNLRHQIKSSTLDVIPFNATLIININYFTQNNQSLAIDINQYMKLSSSIISKIIPEISSFESSQQKQALYASIFKTYSLLTRSLAALTSLVVSYEKIVFFDIFVQKAETKQAKFHRKTAKDVNSQIQLEISRPKASTLFERCYSLLTEALQIQFSGVKHDLSFQELFKSQLLLLNNYWQLHPELIISSSHLLKFLLNNIDERAFIKGVYRLFLSLLPCNDLRILSIINHNFTASFHSIFDNSQLRQDWQMVQICFKLLQHMLRSGMTSLCGMNRYVFCGLLHPSPGISQISYNIVKEIYTNQASEKMLFGNLNESLTFVYNFYFKGQKNPLKLPQLTLQQIQAVRKISYITRPNSKCLLVREKRDLRMKPSFIKKISEILIEKKRMIREDPAYLVFLLKIIKAQESFDFSQLYEILFAVNKISTEIFSFMNHLQTQLENYDEQAEENAHKSLRIYLAYRELLSCLAFLSAYQPVQRQLANYDKLFQSSSLPYISLKNEVPLTPFNLTQPIEQLINIISDDVDTYLDIIAGAIECIPENGKRSQLINNQQEQDGSTTNTTKPKGKQSKGKSNLNQKGTKNGRKMCISGQKRPRTRAYVKEESQNSNGTTFGTSEESIY